MTAWKRRPQARSRKRYPANDDERRAATFAISCRRIGVALSYSEIVELLETHFAGLGRGPSGKFERHLVARICERAAKSDPSVTPKRRSPARNAPKEAAAPAPAKPDRRAEFARFVDALARF